LQTEFRINNHSVKIDAIGIAGVRLDPKGNLQALAASGLKYFNAGKLEIKLDDRTDLALWIDQKGQWKGVIQGLKGNVPAELSKITENWFRLSLAELPQGHGS
jgi:hypothetical protein